jgi:hypothetical protein
MKNIQKIYVITVAIFITILAFLNSCRSTDNAGKRNVQQVEYIESNINGIGETIELSFEKGDAFNHPTFVVWIEDTLGNFIQTLFITKSYGSGTFNYGDKSGGKWKAGQVLRPAALPYWSHKAGAYKGVNFYIPDSVHPVIDAYTGATPKGDFKLQTKADKNYFEKVRILFEINQTWDWNEYWTNNKFPDDAEYKTSCQPAVVYAATIDFSKKGQMQQLKPIGRSSHSGSDGKLYDDLNTITTALHIAERITVLVK